MTFNWKKKKLTKVVEWLLRGNNHLKLGSNERWCTVVYEPNEEHISLSYILSFLTKNLFASTRISKMFSFNAFLEPDYWIHQAKLVWSHVWFAVETRWQNSMISWETFCKMLGDMTVTCRLLVSFIWTSLKC